MDWFLAIYLAYLAKIIPLILEIILKKVLTDMNKNDTM